MMFNALLVLDIVSADVSFYKAQSRSYTVALLSLVVGQTGFLL